MAITHNGWTVSNSVTTISAGGQSTRVRTGDVATVLRYVAQQFHSRVESISTFHGWRSVATNKAVGGIATSNHLSGTAIDLNGGRHAMGRTGTFSANQVAAIRRILAEASVITWGGDFPRLYRSRIDAMHFEIAKGASSAQVKNAVARLGGTSPSRGVLIRATQAAVRATQDGIWGPNTEHRVNVVRSAINGSFPVGVKFAQRVVGATADGIWGAASKKSLRNTVKALQAAWGVSADGIWGPATQSAWESAHQQWNGR